MRKHILFIVENNSIYTDTRVSSEAIAAKEFGYEVSVICPKGKKRKYSVEDFAGIRIYEHPQNFDGSGKLSLILEYINALFWEIVLSIRVFFIKGFDVIHAANPPDHLFFIALPFKLLGAKFIFDHHDITPENYVAKFGSKGLLYRILQLMEFLTFKAADVVISTNDSYKKIALERGRKSKDEVFVVRNGPDIARMRSVQPNGRLRKGFRYLVGYVGIMGEQEGIENLLRTVHYMVTEKQRTDVKFIIVGTGPDWKRMVDLSHDLGLEKYVSFTGFIPDEELYVILSTVDVCVNPEFRNEFTDHSTMIKIMEYMAFGKPVVQFYTTEGAVTAGECAVYVRDNSVEAFAEALIDLLEDEKRRETMARKGYQRVVEELSWESQKDNLKAAYYYVFSM